MKIRDQFEDSLLASLTKPVCVSHVDEIFGCAVYMHLWSIEGLDSIDGWGLFKITEETNDTIECVGLMTLLPTGSVPMEFKLTRNTKQIAWELFVAAPDEVLASVSKAKLWNLVYIYATEKNAAPHWRWGKKYEGILDQA